jgi:hypothetical protein
VSDLTPEEKAELEAKRELARQKRYYRHKKDLHSLLKDRDDIRNYAAKLREKAEVRTQECVGALCWRAWELVKLLVDHVAVVGCRRIV